jgi:hypothetical protein
MGEIACPCHGWHPIVDNVSARIIGEQVIELKFTLGMHELSNESTSGQAGA